MNTRIMSIVATVTLLSLSSGCTSTKNFLFGRGARCGACGPRVNTAPTYLAPQPAAAIPYAPAIPVAPCQQPQCAVPQYQQPVVTAPAKRFGFGCFNRSRSVAPVNVYPGGCGTCTTGCANCTTGCGGCATGCGGCATGNCGGWSSTSSCGDCNASPCGDSCNVGTQGIVNDPYLSSGSMIDGSVMPYDGQIISDTVVGETGQSVIGSSIVPGTTTPQDNFDARGDRIFHAEPLPQGAILN